MVYDENNNPLGNAEISVAGANHDVTTGEKGLPGVSVHYYTDLVVILWDILLNCRVEEVCECGGCL